MNENKKLGLKIKALRKKNGYTQADIAEDLELHVNTIKRYEKGLSVPHEFLKNFSDFLGLDFSEENELKLLYESKGSVEDYLKSEKEKIFYIDKLIELLGYEIISEYKTVFSSEKGIIEEDLKVINLKTGFTYSSNDDIRLYDILYIYDEIEWYIKVLIEKYLKDYKQ